MVTRSASRASWYFRSFVVSAGLQTWTTEMDCCCWLAVENVSYFVEWPTAILGESFLSSEHCFQSKSLHEGDRPPTANSFLFLVSMSPRASHSLIANREAKVYCMVVKLWCVEQISGCRKIFNFYGSDTNSA